MCVGKSGPGLTVIQPSVSVITLLFILMKPVHKLYVNIFKEQFLRFYLLMDPTIVQNAGVTPVSGYMEQYGAGHMAC